MRVQVLISMGQDQLSQEETGRLLDQRIHKDAMNQEL